MLLGLVGPCQPRPTKSFVPLDKFVNFYPHICPTRASSGCLNDGICMLVRHIVSITLTLWPRIGDSLSQWTLAHCVVTAQRDNAVSECHSRALERGL